MVHIILTVLLLAACSCITFSLPKKVLGKSCGKKPLDDIDALISGIMPFGNPKVKPPTSAAELPTFCRVYGKALQQVEESNKKCVKGHYKNMINVVVFSVKKQTKEVCSKRSLQSKVLTSRNKEFLQVGACLNTGNDQLVECANTTTVKLMGIANAEKSQKLPLLCCELLQIKKCILKTLSSQPGCDKEEISQQLKDFVDKFGTSSIASVCAEYNTLKKCQTLSLVYPPLNEAQKVAKTFIVPILSVINDI